ncbi:MAG TPA: RluA family pseudouridine synthase [Isosphaeraceae bacterium]|nr:RluA family pseudouridine synthase [Isosphaeraceae bacterium]
MKPLAVLYEDSDCLAVAKPAGQFSQGTWAPPGEMTLEEAVRRYLDAGDPASVYLGIVHRLDRPTSGVLLWAKTPRAARRLSTQFERRRVVKEYWAIVELGPSCPAATSWCDWLTRPSETGLARVVAPGTPGARPAVTRVRREMAPALPPGRAWLRLWPETGRTHQLRAQAAARGMPILGDAAYGSTSSFEPAHAIALHARLLEVRHPILQTPMRFVAPLPDAWHSLGVQDAVSG